MNIFDTHKGAEALESLIHSLEDISEGIKTLNHNLEILIRDKEKDKAGYDRNYSRLEPREIMGDNEK